jgi:N-dimethylarginine dimethylaminohydrolase
MTLPWGRRYLMCPPEHFGVLYEINPWMRREVPVDLHRARTEWDRLAATLADAGAAVEVMEPVEALPDLVFTANAGLVDGQRFIPARFRNPERQGETPYAVEWFRQRGYVVDELPAEVSHEGAGDALPFRNSLLGGYRWRSDARAHAAVSRLTGTAVRIVELVDPRLYHVDLTFCPLDEQRAIVVPEAWDSYGWKVVAGFVPEPLVLTLDEALTFCANSVVVGDRIIMPCCPPRVGHQLEAWGFDIAVCAVDEFLKAGGGCRCLTLALDVELGPTRAR